LGSCELKQLKDLGVCINTWENREDICLKDAGANRCPDIVEQRKLIIGTVENDAIATTRRGPTGARLTLPTNLETGQLGGITEPES
jgi:hypothetical protein